MIGYSIQKDSESRYTRTAVCRSAEAIYSTARPVVASESSYTTESPSETRNSTAETSEVSYSTAKAFEAD